MAKQTSIKSKKVAKKAAVKLGAAKPSLLAGGNPDQVNPTVLLWLGPTGPKPALRGVGADAGWG